MRNTFVSFIIGLLILGGVSFYYSNVIYIKYIEYAVPKYLNNISRDLEISIENISIKRNFFQYSVKLKNISINQINTNNASFIQEVLVQLRWKSIFSNIKLSKIEAKKANFNIENAESLLEQLKSLLLKAQTTSKLEFANEFFVFFIDSRIGEEIIDNARIRLVNQKIDVNIHTENDYENLYIDFENEHYKTFSIKFNNINRLKKIFTIFFNNNDTFSKSNLKLSGRVHVTLDRGKPLIEGKISQVNGNYYAFDKTFNIKDGNFHLLYSDDIVYLNNVNLNIDGAKFTGKIQSDDNNAIIEGNLSNALVKNVQKFWPEDVEPVLRTWLVTNINSGKFVSSYVFLNTKESLFFIEDAIFSNLTFTIPITKLNKQLILSHAFGTFRFNDNKFNLSVEKALNGKMETAFNLEALKDNDNANTYTVTVKGTASSTIKEAYKNINQYFSLPIEVEYIDEKGLLSASFLLLINISETGDDIYLKENIFAEIDNFKAKNVYNMFNLSANKIGIEIKSKQIKFFSESSLNDRNVSILGEYNLQNGFMDVNMIGDFSLTDMKKLSPIYLGNFIKGYANGKIRIKKISGEYHIKTHLNLEENTIDLSYLRFHNEKNTEKSSLTIEAILTHTSSGLMINLNKLQLSGKDVNIDISGYISKNTINMLSNTFIVANNKIKFKFSLEENKITLYLKGDSLNLSEYMLKDFDDFEKHKKANIYIDIEKILLKNNVYIIGSVLKLNEDILGSTFNTSFENGDNVVAKINEFGLDLVSSNAGLLLKSLNVTDSIRNGDLKLHLDLNNSLRTKPGMLVINKFFIIKASILAQILSSASFIGMLDTLNGEGIRFKKLVAPIKYADNIVYFDESWAEGDALGISFKGPVNLIQEEIMFFGTIVPIYKLNKLIWRIPIFGKIVTGGKSRGILAASYNIRKHGTKTIVNVDTLSTLTPTMLQRVFDIFK